MEDLVAEGISPGSPPGEEQREADGLKDTSNASNGHLVDRALLGDDLGDELSTN